MKSFMLKKLVLSCLLFVSLFLFRAQEAQAQCNFTFQNSIDCSLTVDVQLICGGVVVSSFIATMNPGSWAAPTMQSVPVPAAFCTSCTPNCTLQVRINGVLVSSGSGVCCTGACIYPQCMTANCCGQVQIGFNCSTRIIKVVKPPVCP